MARKAIKFPLVFLLLLIMMTGCQGGRNGRLPASTGQPYEVVLEGDTANILSEILTEDVPGLPQSEPLCNVINVKRGKVQGSYLMVRTRIVVDIDQRYKKFSVQSSKDVNASPQLVIHIKAKSAEQLRATLDDKNAEKLRALIDQSELQHLATIIQQNPEKQREVKRMFGIDMKIPASLDASKKTKGFLWLSNNASSGMQNLIIFRLKGNGCTEPNAWSYHPDDINKVLKLNILGETNNMYMQLASLEDKTVSDQETELDEDLITTKRGLWEMKGDAMGGPYLLKVLPISNGKIVTPRSAHKQMGKIDSRIVVIGFVYAPEMKKRNLLKQLEAVLTTIK